MFYGILRIVKLVRIYPTDIVCSKFAFVFLRSNIKPHCLFEIGVVCGIRIILAKIYHRVNNSEFDCGFPCLYRFCDVFFYANPVHITKSENVEAVFVALSGKAINVLKPFFLLFFVIRTQTGNTQTVQGVSISVRIR